MRSFCRFAFTVVVMLAIMLPLRAEADWTAYVTGQIGIATGNGDLTGTLTGPTIPFSDSDRDSSPMMATSVGLSIPLDEVMAWELPYDLQLPDWPMRTELEFAGLRNFEYRTVIIDVAPPGFDEVFLASSSSWAMMINNWFDVPMTTTARPLAWAFRTRRTTVARVLEPIVFNVGVGIGMSVVHLDAISTAARAAQDKRVQFAWQVGAGFGYELTPFVTIDVGYRFFKSGELDSNIIDSTGTVRGSVVFSEHINEFRSGIRVNVYSFMSPWDRLK